jgi:hypothetical protein
MKSNFENKIKKEAIAEMFQKTVDAGKKVALSTKENVVSAIEKAKSAALMNKLKKLNPVFPQQYESEEFKLPNVVMIVDDAVRRGNKLCEGAVGWLSNDAGVEIFCLYDEAVEFSKIQFIPAPICDAVYCVDSYDRNRFIRTDCIFSKAHEERIAELKHIAHCLGAKRCSIEINESQADVCVQSRSVSAKEVIHGIEAQESMEASLTSSGSDSRRGTVEIEFEGKTGEMLITAPGTYTVTQKPMAGDNLIIESFFVNVPNFESDITKEVDQIPPASVEIISEIEFEDLIFYFAIALVSLLFVEWILQSKKNY